MDKNNDGVYLPKNKGILRNIKAYLDRNRMGELLVLRERLSPWQLKEALSRQQLEQRPLGQILVEEGWVTQGQIRWTLATQAALRCGAAVVTLLVSASSLHMRPAWAGSSLMKEETQSTMVHQVSYSPDVTDYALFGTGEKRSTDLSAFSKWRSVFDRFSYEARSASSNAVLIEWKNNLRQFKNQPIEQMASNVNDMVNRVRYISDNRNWGKSDYWETPTEFFSKGGDCEDFAITKYASLRALGVPDSHMRLAVVKDTQKNIPHAILIVYTESGPMVLDNQIKKMRPADSISHYKPIFSINRSAWWLHTGRESSTQIASAR